ncbi:MAG TPA: DUF2927 domain-containing protein [Crinalium sp.]|jgi:hypothetical protein
MRNWRIVAIAFIALLLGIGTSALLLQVLTRETMPRTAAVPKPTRQSSTASSQPTPSPHYTQEQLDYFLEIALNSEYGGSDEIIKKWEGDVKIQSFGTPTLEDLDTLRQVTQEINGLTRGAIQLELVTSNPNVEIYFVPESDFKQYEPNYVPVNLGFFWTWWSDRRVLYRARILITTVGVTQRERSHLIREELTQSLGLMQDSYRYPDSIFYQGWTDVNQYTDIDRALISLLYRPELSSGMSRAEAIAALQPLVAH